MDEAPKTLTSEGPDARKWIGRLIIAVILGEAIWSLIVSVMNNLVVPWLGDVIGQSSRLPTSFTQRPYNYPDLFVSILEFGIAATIAVILNYFFQRQRVIRVKPVNSPVPVEPARVVPQAVTVANTQGTSAVALPAPATKPDFLTPAAPIKVAPAGPAPSVSQTRPVAVAPPAPPVAKSPATKPLPTAPKAEPPKVNKPKEAYYNSVGEPVPSDDD
jgi:large-conductance mechanosensitive channel